MKRALTGLLAGLLLSTPTLADLALAKAKNCLSCHTIDKKVVGPSYQEIARKYAGQKDAVDKLAAKIMKGGAGVWGPVPMPVNKQVSDEEARRLASWVMTLR